MSRTKMELLPEFSAELEEIRTKGISKGLLQKIITKHQANAAYNRKLYERYMTLQEGVPIFGRKPRYEDEDKPINNKINNDFLVRSLILKQDILQESLLHTATAKVRKPRK